MNDEDIEKIARKVLELQAAGKAQNAKRRNKMAEVTNKYDRQIFNKFGTCYRVEEAVRTVAVYSQGEKCVKDLSNDKLQKASEFAEELYKKILGE